jgi:hypothetical protein
MRSSSDLLAIVKSIAAIPNPTNASLLGEFYGYIKETVNQKGQSGNLKILMTAIISESLRSYFA